jgi:murein tripeptide amidase MpaA
VRPRITRRDLTRALQTLNARETSGNGEWVTDNREMTSAVKFLDETGSLAQSSLEPENVLEAFSKGKYKTLGLY